MAEIFIKIQSVGKEFLLFIFCKGGFLFDNFINEIILIKSYYGELLLFIVPLYEETQQLKQVLHLLFALAFLKIKLCIKKQRLRSFFHNSIQVVPSSNQIIVPSTIILPCFKGINKS